MPKWRFRLRGHACSLLDSRKSCSWRCPRPSVEPRESFRRLFPDWETGSTTSDCRATVSPCSAKFKIKKCDFIRFDKQCLNTQSRYLQDCKPHGLTNELSTQKSLLTHYVFNNNKCSQVGRKKQWVDSLKPCLDHRFWGNPILRKQKQKSQLKGGSTN